MEQEFVISNRLGLHVRAAAQFVKVANAFACTIMVKRSNMEVNGKSIMGLLTLAAGRGTRITVGATGSDAVDALAAIERLINGKFGEE